MSGVDLPTGLRGAYEALSWRGDHAALRRLTSAVWLRILLDPACPDVGGIDPRAVVVDAVPWADLAEPSMLDAAGARFNEILACGDLLSTDWHELPDTTVAKVVAEVTRWRPETGGQATLYHGDLLGEISQRVRCDAARSGRGEYYTPYNVSLMMATMVAPGPGDRVLDPACGSGRMLLAAAEACRREHGVDAVPELFGIDISPDAVRLCQLNLALAGIAPAYRVECRDALVAIPFEECTPAQKAMQLGLFGYEAGEPVGWRKREAA